MAGTIATAQAGRGGISGLVSDPSGAMVRGAKITVQNNATGVVLSAVTNAAGQYTFVSLTPGTYTVTASQKGFDTDVHNDVSITVDQVSALNITLRVGEVNEVVTVSEASSLVETSNSTLGQLITESTIDRVPLVTRDVYELVQLSAGVNPANGTPNASSTTGVYNSRPGADVSGYTINGALQGTVNYMLDGSPIAIAENNLATLIPAFQVPQDDIEEYRVETQNTPATYQSSGAGAISLVTKSGSNQFHGDGFVYLRPDIMAANDYFYKQNQLASNKPNQTAAFHRYQEGGSFSGPILHKKLFFFGDYEATQQESLQTGNITVPTAAERQGDFTADSFTVYNPLVADKADGTRQQMVGTNDGPGCATAKANCIPKADLNPIALKYAAVFPAPNKAGKGTYHTRNLFASGMDPNNAQKFDIRGDYYPSEKQRMFSRFSFARLKFGNADLDGAANIYDPNFYQNITNARNIIIGDDYTLNQNSMLQFRYSFARHYENQTGDPRQIGFDMTTLGFPSSLVSEQVYKDIPFISFSDATTNLGSNPWTTFQFVSENSDALVTYTATLGRHQISAGLEFQKQFMNEGQPVAPSGQYAFDTTPTSSTTWAGDGDTFAAFLLGMGSAPGQEGSNFTKDIFGADANPYYAAFIQDDYRLSSTLTVNLGLRWDIFGGRTERHNRMEFFDPTVQYTVNGVSLTGGEEFAGQGRSRSPFTTNLKNFGPRIGIAWQPLARTVVRAGGGIYYGPSTQMVANSALNSDGFYAATTWNATEYNADGNTVMLNSLSNPFPNGIVQPTKGKLGPATGIGNTLSTELHSQKTPTTYDFNLGIEHEFPHDVVLSAAYVGSRGLYLPLSGVDLNQLPLGTIASYKKALLNKIPNKWAAALPSTAAFYGASTVPQWMGLEPYPQYSPGSINTGVSVAGYPGGDSEYSSLQMKVQKRLAKHFTTLASYTWGKIMTDDYDPPMAFVGSHGAEAPQDWRNLNLEHALSGQDIKYQFTWQASYDLPVGKGRALNLNRVGNTALGGWTMSAIAYKSSGVPVNAPNGTGDSYFSQRVNMNCDPGKGAKHTAAEWFTYTCFSQPSSDFVAGTASAFLSHVRTNGAHDIDLTLLKNFPLGKNANVRFEISSFNITNSVQLGFPSVFWNENPTADNMAGFGEITSDVNTPRQFQFGSKFTF
jgi:hypothetical protein